MTTMLRSVWVGSLALLAFAAGCSCSTPSGARNICTLPSPPLGCGATCSAASPCRAGTHCLDARCAAECSAARPCLNGAPCSADGRCGMAMTFDGSRPDGANDAAIVPWDAPPQDRTCAAVQVGTMMATPNVIVIVDQSGSMGTNRFPPGSSVTRWQALETALMAPAGLVRTLEGSVRWGMAWFRGGTNCPQNTRTVMCALNNYGAINSVYTTLRPGGATPTGEAIDLILNRRDMLISDPMQPTIFILATDGDPNTCADTGATTQGMMNTIAALTTAHSLGINTYVIGVGSDALTANLQAMANAGVGSSGSPPAQWWMPADTAGLSDALTTIVGGVRSCNLTLMGAIDPAQACSGSVTLAGTNLACNDPNGWHAVDRTHIALDGTACTMLLSGVTPLVATFPCGVVVM